MSVDHSAKPAITSVLKDHFPNCSDSQIATYAEQIASSDAVNLAFQELQHSNTDPQKDKEAIAKAAVFIERARKQIANVGWHGQKTLEKPLALLSDETERRSAAWLRSQGGKREILEQRLAALAEELRDSADQVKTDGKSLNTAFGDGPEFEEFNSGKTKKYRAYYTARACAAAYYELSNLKPTVSTSTSSGTAYGPFLSFVKDVFAALSIDGSPEVWARNATKEFSPQNT